MKMKHAFWMFLGVLSGGLTVSYAWDLLSGAVTEEIAVHALILLLLLAASVFFFGKYIHSRNAEG